MIMDCISSNRFLFFPSLIYPGVLVLLKKDLVFPLVSLIIRYAWEELNKKPVSEKYRISKKISSITYSKAYF